MEKNRIILQFDDEKDCQQVLKALEKKTDITWDNGNRKAMVKLFLKTRVLLISKSIYEPPKPIRL